MDRNEILKEHLKETKIETKSLKTWRFWTIILTILIVISWGISLYGFWWIRKEANGNLPAWKYWEEIIYGLAMLITLKLLFSTMTEIKKQLKQFKTLEKEIKYELQ